MARFSSAMESVPLVLVRASEVLRIHVAVLVKERMGRLRTIVWSSPDVPAATIDEAKADARIAYSFYATNTPPTAWVRGSEKGEEEAVRLEGLGRSKPGSPVHWLTLPLSADRRVVGVLRIHCEKVLQESDRTFLIAVAQQIGLALDRDAAQNRALAALADVRLALQGRDTFISTASHELRNPIGALTLRLGILEKLVSRNAEKTQIANHLESTRHQVERLNRLVENLLDASRIKAGRLVLELENLDLSAVLGEVVAREQVAWAREGCNLTLRSGGPIVGRWDRLRLDQVITNLLSNALKYGLGNPVEVVLEADARRAKLSVRDHGIGIAPEDRARIFQPFERAVDPRSFRGLGLGLWIVRQIVEAMGGTIRVESVVGAGSTFTVELPRRHRSRRAVHARRLPKRRRAG
jgi:signal transduction histidine kinase